MPRKEIDYYTVALIGSSGGGTATLGHNDAIALITTIHYELLRVRNKDAASEGSSSELIPPKRVCLGLSQAIFVSLCDGSGFDSIRDDDWKPHEAGSNGPEAALYTVGFKREEDYYLCNPPNQFRVDLIAKEPLSKINHLVNKLDVELASRNQLENSCVRAIISLSSEPSLFHQTLTNASAKPLPVTGSGGTSLGILASKYDLKIVGNSGGSVASTTLTKQEDGREDWPTSGVWNMILITNQIMRVRSTPTMKRMLHLEIQYHH
jgi:hypothetical protein